MSAEVANGNGNQTQNFGETKTIQHHQEFSNVQLVDYQIKSTKQRLERYGNKTIEESFVSTQQRGISLPKPIWDWIFTEYRNFGYQYPSWFVREEMIMYALKHNPKLINDKKCVSEIEKFDEIKKISETRKGRKFSLVHAVNDYKEDINGFKELLKEGWISKKQYDALVIETEEQHKKVVQLELSKNKKPKSKYDKEKHFRLVYKHACSKCKQVSPHCKRCKKMFLFGIAKKSDSDIKVGKYGILSLADKKIGDYLKWKRDWEIKT